MPLTAAGAVLAAAGVALAAYAAHATDRTAGPGVRESLQSAALMALAHGIALAALARQTVRRIGLVALWTLLVGVLLFSGGLLVAHVFDVRARTAPFGGSLLILGWLLYAAGAIRK